MYSAVWTASIESGRGQPHFKTLARSLASLSFREVFECNCPLPLCRRIVSVL